MARGNWSGSEQTGKAVSPEHGVVPFGEAPMSSLSERGRETARNERVIGSLRDRTGAPLAVVRSLFAQEFSRLELGAKVRSYLAVLTASNVRAILRQKRGMLL
jgi:hypothetical protein